CARDVRGTGFDFW
nr:immunoglobulin heavy chain junction region [Macaca mulatta]MOX58740.1 immunoglobulin heavy chain junction region [Macaca mulatta]MOX59036.1 immunoglobulin heavy chain junction region [Macaca mulatta]MOX59150.1 immunoglobulin heavy chain junction region [Macaca mulatta]MOX59191.1 immunoglobulin heavy chain junction region [Macaca mulatta]